MTVAVRQPTFAEVVDEGAGSDEAHREAERAMDQVRDKFGARAIRPATAISTPTSDRSTTTFQVADLS